MDEPLSNLDAALRVQTRAEILKLQKRLGTTTIYVTHDQVEAMTMGDRIAVMREGELQQIGTPEELYTRPANTFVATFIGSPAMNLVPPRSWVSARIRCSPASGPSTSDVGSAQNGSVGFEAVVEVVEYLGDERLAHLRLGERVARGEAAGGRARRARDHRSLCRAARAVLFFAAETGIRTVPPS